MIEKDRKSSWYLELELHITIHGTARIKLLADFAEKQKSFWQKSY